MKTPIQKFNIGDQVRCEFRTDTYDKTYMKLGTVLRGIEWDNDPKMIYVIKFDSKSIPCTQTYDPSWLVLVKPVKRVIRIV